MKKNSSLSVGHQENRGRLVVRFLEEAIKPLEGLDVLDLGCGPGVISAALSVSRARLTLTDFSVDNVKRAHKRLRSTPDPIFSCTSSALDLPFPTLQFDCVLLNGVLEWVGKAAPQKNPEVCQLQVLKEVYRILKKDGWLYLAIENRYYPPWVMHDPHVKIPLVAVLPRRIATRVHRWLTGNPYITYIHSYRKLRSLLRDAGFGEVKFYIPLLHYRWPFKVVPAEDSRCLAREITALRQQLRNRDGSLSFSEKLKFTLYYYTALLGLGRLLFPSFVVLARRT